MKTLKKFAWMFAAAMTVAGFTACSNTDDPDEPTPNPNPTPDPVEAVTDLSVDFSVVTEGYVDVDVWYPAWTCEMASGDRKWQGYRFEDKTNLKIEKFAQASAHDSNGANAGTHYESWMISPALNVKDAAEKVFSFRSEGSFWKATSSLKVYVLSEPKSTAAVKEELTVKVATEADGNYVWVESGDIDLSGKGDVVYIGFCYEAEGGKSNSTTYRIDDFAFGHKQVAHPEDEALEVNPDAGKLDLSDAVAVAEALTHDNAAKDVVKVKGYIVGCLAAGCPTSFDTVEAAAESMEWAAPFTGSTTVLIADNAEEKDVTKCIFVKLNDQVSSYPGAEGLRSAAQLSDYNGKVGSVNLGKVLGVKGKKMAGFKSLPMVRDMEGWNLLD